MEEFIAEQDGRPLHLKMELDRSDYEELISPLLDKTVKCVDAALADAKLHAQDLDKIILVGGSSRTPLVHQLLETQLSQKPHLEIDPDLCVAMGAAVQGGLIAGADVGPVLVDITPHTLGVECLGSLHGVFSPYVFSAIIPRNTPLPATRSEIYHTAVEGQEKAEIHVLQGEDEDARRNASVGKFMLEGLDESAAEGSEILVRFDLNLDGILTVTAVERATGLEEKLTIKNPISQFRAKDRGQAKAKLASLFADGPAVDTPGAAADQPPTGELALARQSAQELISKARKIADSASPDDAVELQELVEQLQAAVQGAESESIQAVSNRLEDLVFYLEDA